MLGCFESETRTSFPAAQCHQFGYDSTETCPFHGNIVLFSRTSSCPPSFFFWNQTFRKSTRHCLASFLIQNHKLGVEWSGFRNRTEMQYIEAIFFFKKKRETLWYQPKYTTKRRRRKFPRQWTYRETEEACWLGFANGKGIRWQTKLTGWLTDWTDKLIYIGCWLSDGLTEYLSNSLTSSLTDWLAGLSEVLSGWLIDLPLRHWLTRAKRTWSTKKLANLSSFAYFNFQTCLLPQLRTNSSQVFRELPIDGISSAEPPQTPSVLAVSPFHLNYICEKSPPKQELVLCTPLTVHFWVCRTS